MPSAYLLTRASSCYGAAGLFLNGNTLSPPADFSGAVEATAYMQTARDTV